MKVKKSVTDENRAAVLAAASTTMRAEGVGEASLADIAAKAGLTHGAIYRQFPSKTALACAVVAHDYETILALLHDQGMSFQRYVETYLSAQHRDYFPWGCPVGALSGEMNKLDATVQQVFAAGLAQNITALADLIPAPDPEAAASAALAMMVGALSMARAVKASDPVLSDAILASARDHLLGLYPAGR